MKNKWRLFFSAVAATLFPRVSDGPETAVMNIHIFAIAVSGMS